MMKKIFLLLTILIGLTPAAAQAQKQQRWEFINPAQLQVTIVPEKTEVVAGTLATFTISIRNRTDHSVSLAYTSGQQWDLAAYHKKIQIFRWSQGMTWSESNYNIALKRGETRSEQLTWLTVDRNGSPLPHGVYTVHGMALIAPRRLVSNDCSIRLLPPEVKPMEVIEAKLGQLFEVEVPRYSGKRELSWQVDYVRNDNRLSQHSLRKTADKCYLVFYPARLGHVEFHLYFFHDTQDASKSIERRSYRVEIR